MYFYITITKEWAFVKSDALKNKAEAEKKLQALVAKAKSGETLTDAEQKAYRTYRTEVGAFANQRLLGNKSFVKKLITTEPTTAEKLIGKLREMRENLKARKDPEAREQLDFVRKAEKLFMQGLSEAGGTIDSNGKIHLANREEDEPVSKGGETVIATAENVSESSKSVRRLANPKSVDNLTEEQYNNFGWVRANDILESDEYERAMSDFASLKKGDQYRKTAEGEFVIPTSKYYGVSEGTVSAIVFVKGEMDLPNITRIWLLNHSNSQTLKKVRGVICERLLERRKGTRDFVGDLYGEEFIGEYRASDFPTYQEYQNQLRQQREGEQSSGRRSGENYRNNQEQQYRGRNSQETGSVVISDSRLTPPSFAPVRKEYVDVTGNKRYVLEHNKGEYFIWGTYSPRPHYFHPSIEAAIEAENNSLLRAYARDTGQSIGDVKKLLGTNSNLLKVWERKRLQEKLLGSKVSRSRNVSETVTLSKGQIAALRANYEGDKVFTKKEVAAAISTIDALQKLPAKERSELVTHLWRGYNERLNEQGFGYPNTAQPCISSIPQELHIIKATPCISSSRRRMHADA